MRRTVTGAYDVVTWAEWSDGRAFNEGDLVTDWDGDGWLVMWGDTLDMQAPSSEGLVFFVSSHAVDASGQVSLALDANDPLEGFQTEEGFYAAGAVGTATLEILAGEAEWHPLVSNGIYDVEIRATYTSPDRGASGTRSDWTGQAAIVTANDSVYVSLTLRDGHGGVNGMVAEGPLTPEGEFVLEAGDPETPQTLSGSLVSGRLEAEWADVQPGGVRLEGRLVGRRR